MPCGSCGGRGAEPAQEVIYTSPQGKTVTLSSETEAKIQVSINGGGSYIVKKRK